MQEVDTSNDGGDGPDGAIEDWLAAQAPRYRDEAWGCARLAAAANGGDAEGVEALLAEGCSFATQSSVEVREGRESVAWKLTAGHGADPRRHHFELATCPGDGRPGVLVHQRDEAGILPGLGERAATLVVTLDGAGRVSEVFGVTLLPQPASVRGSGLFPGLGEEELERERSRPGLSVRPEALRSLHLFVLAPGEHARAVEARVREQVEGLGLPELVVRFASEATPAEVELQGRAGVVCYPTLLLEHAEGFVHLPVWESGEALEARLRALLGGCGAEG